MQLESINDCNFAGTNLKKLWQAGASALVVATAAAWCGTASAQATSAPASNSDENDIVVYAQKRGAEKLQDVPIAITAFSGERLEQGGVKNLQSLTYSIPNVSLDNIGAPIANFAIRGLSSNSSIPSLDPPVGTFVDGVYLGTNAVMLGDFFDIESVEVLRGPQGVLQGKNVAGGAVMIRTKRPSFDFGVNAKLGVNSFPGGSAAASVEGPLGDQVAAKLVGYYSKDGGWAKNVAVGRDVGRMTNWYVRPSLLLKADDINAYLVFEHGNTHGDSPVEKNLTYFSTRNFGKFSVANNTLCCTSINWTSATLETNARVNFGDGTITSITGWRDIKNSNTNDTDSLPTSIFDLTAATYSQQFSQEMRYSGSFFDMWDATLGGYYFNQNLKYYEARDFGTTRTSFGGEVKTISIAAFLDNKVHLTDSLVIDAGLRYTNEKKSAKIAPQGAPISAATSTCNFAARTCNFTFSGSHRSRHVTTRFALDWKPTDDITLYISRDEGLRSGGYNVRHTSPTVTPRSTNDEEITSYEVGGKFILLDRRLTLNLAAFQMDVDNILRDSVVFVTGVGFVQLNQNAGNARVKGFEGEATVRVTDGLKLNGSVGYLDNSYRKVFLDITGDGVVNAADYGLTLPRLSKWTTSIGATYNIGQFTLWANYAYRSRAPYPDNNKSFIPASNVVDSSIAWNVTDNVSVTLWGKNLLNELILTSNTNAGAAIGDIAYIRPGRQFGADLRAKF